jgi:hypothetical protein
VKRKELCARSYLYLDLFPPKVLPIPLLPLPRPPKWEGNFPDKAGRATPGPDAEEGDENGAIWYLNALMSRCVEGYETCSTGKGDCFKRAVVGRRR